MPKDQLVEIWAKQKELSKNAPVDLGLAEDERVEDAGLEAEEEPVVVKPTPKKKAKERVAA